MRDHFVVRARWYILAVLVALCAWILPGVRDVVEDDDVLAFLPNDHADVIAFREIAERFGVLEIGLVGLHKTDGDMLSVERVDEVRALSQALGELPGVRMVLSFTDLPDPQVTEDGLEVAALVPEDLRDPEKIRAKVLGSTDAVGNFISADGKAAALMIFLLHDKDRTGPPRGQILQKVRDVVAERWQGESHVGGAPFVEDAAARSSRSDVNRLSPIVIGVLVLVSAVLLGSITAAGLNLILTGLGVGLVMGAHGRFGIPLTIVSSSLPVMMVALGGAFGVHILAGFQRQQGTSHERASATLRELWLPVVLSGVTTAVAFYALVVMPQVPMKDFGIIAGTGVLALLLLALGVLPALLAVLPGGLLKPRAERPMPMRLRPPLWLMLVLAVAGAAMATRLHADPDMTAVFSEESEPVQSNNFFNKHFGGSNFLQVALEAEHVEVDPNNPDRKPLSEPAVLREIRDIGERVRAIDGVVDLRSVVEPVMLLNEALGGRRGIPETAGRGGRVLTYLQGHPAVAQLITPDAAGALIHIKLAPMSGERQIEVTQQVREILTRNAAGRMRVAKTSDPAVRAVQLAEVGEHLTRLTGKPVDAGTLAVAAPKDLSPAMLAAITEVRDRALDSEDSPVSDVPRVEIDAIDPASLVTPRGAELEALLRDKLPTLAAKDPEGIGFVAKHLGPWTDEVLARFRVEGRCGALGLPLVATEPGGPSCAPVQAALSELDDEEWRVTTGEGRELTLRTRLTGQPVIGAAFAESETRSLFESTLVSLIGLALTLLVARQLRALIPALWTLCVTMGLLALLGLPISVGTSMISCIAIGAGVDFAIHLGFRARTFSGPDSGQRAVDEIGVVTLISALQLACAFAVLMASELAPLREFGIGLAIGLVGAALGACWLVPWLYRGAASKQA
ncbi:MAG TPA: MMPL family transporter [Nannocystis sp.]|jgi:predicted RND superfamily exporter protein